MAATDEIQELVLSCKSKSKILSWNVAIGDKVKKDSVLATYVFTEKVADPNNFIVNRKLKAKCPGTVTEIAVAPEQEVQRGQVVARLKETQCQHNTVIKDMCVDCGADLRREPGIPGELSEPVTASIPAVHNILELKVSVEEALRLARYDEEQLLKARKLVLVVDLDMTLIHTTVQHVPKGTKDVFSFTLPGHQYEYHTKLRPNARKFLESISKFFELHIFTMGSRMYAHTVAKCLDPDGKFFAHRIRSRDEFINSFSKFHDLKALFPCGDHMVCIIDDREDVWSYAPNLIVVKPYKIFKGSDDINDPFKPELTLNDSFGVNGKQMNIPVTEPKPEEGKIGESENATDMKEEKEASEEKEGEKTEEAVEQSNDTSAINTPTTQAKETPPPIEASKENEAQQPQCLQVNRPFLNDAKADLDDYLFYLDEILERIHFYFYSTLDAVKSKGGVCRTDPDITKFCTVNTLNPDVRVIVPEIRRMTLKGCNLVFTGVVPTNIPLEKSKPWRAAISLGARVSQNVIPKTCPEAGLATTHVVAARHGTRKAFEASRSPDIHLVNPAWLWCASERWEWPEEGVFPVPLVADKNGKKSPVVSRQGTPLASEFELKNNKKLISPLAKDFEMPPNALHPGNYDPANFLKDQIRFSKQELDAMDKEVEELMQSGASEDEESDNEGDKEIIKKIEQGFEEPKTRKRKASDSSDRNSPSIIKPKKLNIPSRIENSDQSRSPSTSLSPSGRSSPASSGSHSESRSPSASGSPTSGSSSGESTDGDDDDDDDNSSESGTSSSSSDGEDGESSGSSSEDENSMANMLERRISECSDDS